MPSNAPRRLLLVLLAAVLTVGLPLMGAGSASAATPTNACGSSYKAWAAYFLKSTTGAKGGIVRLSRNSSGKLCATTERIGDAHGVRGKTSVSLTPAGGKAVKAKGNYAWFVGPAKASYTTCIRVKASVSYGGSTYRFNRSGWCKTKVGKASATIEKAISVALAQQGKPYEWGAEGPSSFDCSGLTSYAYAAAGVKLPRVSRDQYATLPHTTSPQRGDLVFFGSPVYHVGIYLGDGLMVHAPKTGDVVKVVKVSSQYSPPQYGSMH